MILPDSTELELADGATGLEAARAIGPKLAEQAVLVKADGVPQDLRLPLARRGEAPDPDDARHAGSRRARRPPPLGRPPARRGGAAAPPGRQGGDRAADRQRLLLRLRVPGPDQRRRPRGDRGRGAARARRGAGLGARGDHGRRGADALHRRGRAVQGRAGRDRRGRHLALHAGRLHRPLPRPAPADLGADQGLQAHLARRRLLARRREEHAADADLRDGVLQPEGPRRAPRAARAGARPRPPASSGQQLDLFHFDEHSPGIAVLAPEGHGDLQRARGPPAARERAARLLAR